MVTVDRNSLGGYGVNGDLLILVGRKTEVLGRS